MTSTVSLGIQNISNEEHHAIRALSNSVMKDLAVSPFRCWYRHINPAPKPEDEDTASQKIGSAIHCAVLEPEAFDSRYACEIDPSDWPVCLDTMQDIKGWIADKGEKPKGTRKDDMIAQAEAIMLRIGEKVPILQREQERFAAENEGKTVLHSDEWERVAGMALALSEEPALKPILAEGKAEVSMLATDPETGVTLKARLDWMAPKFTLDLKTFTQKRGKSIDRSINDAIVYEGYNNQAFTYDMVRRLVTGEGPGDFDSVYAFVESDQPHEVRLKRLVPKASHGANLYWLTAQIEVRRLIRLYAECLDKFGDKPWRTDQEIARLTDEDVPQFSYGAF